MSGETGSGKSMRVARHEDDDDDDGSIMEFFLICFFVFFWGGGCTEIRAATKLAKTCNWKIDFLREHGEV